MTQQPTRVEEALRQADSLADPQRSAEDAKVRPPDEDPGRARAYVPPEGIKAEVHLYSDGCFAQTESDVLKTFAAGNLDINYHRIAGTNAAGADNVGLVSFTVSSEERANQLIVSARVLNFRRDETAIKVELTTRVWGHPDFKLADRVLRLDGRQPKAGDLERKDKDRGDAGEGLASFAIAPPGPGERLLLHARLLDPRDDSPHRDQFPFDDQAWLIVGPPPKARVLVVTTGNEALDLFFGKDGARGLAEVAFLDPGDADYAGKYRRALGDVAFDLIIFDRCTPPQQKDSGAAPMPAANTFFLDQVPPPLGPLSPEQKDKRLFRPLARIVNPSHRHRLMRGLSGLDELFFTRAFRFDLDPDKYPNVPRLLETEKEGAVLFALPRGNYTDLVLTASLVTEQGKIAKSSNWPVTPGFVLFLSNVIHTLGNVREARAEETVQPGQLKTIRPDAVVSSVQVLPPGTDQWQTIERGSEAGDFSYIAEQVGVYRMRWEKAGQVTEQPFVVNLLDADESDIQSPDAITLGDQKLAAVKGPPATVDTWKWGVILAVVLLAVEWVLYQRRFLN